MTTIEAVERFTPTEWATADDKVWFFQHFQKFVKSGFRRSLFTKRFYNRLSLTFGHIAHYNQGGFWEEYFTTDEDKARFIRDTMGWPCYGDPAFTYSDVERALIEWLRKQYPQQHTFSF